MSEYRSGNVFIQNQLAGLIEETDDGYRFTYLRKYLNSEKPVSVSLTMPLREQPYESNILFPFFDGLIPEGWLLHVVTKNWKIEGTDRFGILLVACRDCIGDVSIQSGDVS